LDVLNETQSGPTSTNDCGSSDPKGRRLINFAFIGREGFILIELLGVGFSMILKRFLMGRLQPGLARKYGGGQYSSPSSSPE